MSATTITETTPRRSSVHGGGSEHRSDAGARSPRPSGARKYTVIAQDGVELAVREFGPRDAAMTVVLLHGHTLREESWAFVRSLLLRGRSDLRVVSYDHRGHGRSGRGAAHTYRIDQLARDLHVVLDAVAPTGDVVLAGHSMGAMTILSFARQYPLEIGARIKGVALVAGAAGGLTETGAGRLLHHPVVDVLRKAALRAPGTMTRAKHVVGHALHKMVTRERTEDNPVSPRLKTLVGVLKNKTSIEAIAGFLSSFATFDETEALPLLAAVPTVIVYGTEYQMTPQEMSLSMASRIPGAHLHPVLEAGHGLIIEQPRPVARALAMLAAHVAPWAHAHPTVAA